MTSALARQDCARDGPRRPHRDHRQLRIVADSTFDPPGQHGYLTKTAGPAAEEADLGPVDLVPVSHAVHPDNLDDRGWACALAAALVRAGEQIW